MIREEHVFKVSKEIENLIIILVCLKIEKVFHFYFHVHPKLKILLWQTNPNLKQ